MNKKLLMRFTAAVLAFTLVLSLMISNMALATVPAPEDNNVRLFVTAGTPLPAPAPENTFAAYIGSPLVADLRLFAAPVGAQSTALTMLGNVSVIYDENIISRPASSPLPAWLSQDATMGPLGPVATGQTNVLGNPPFPFEMNTGILPNPMPTGLQTVFQMTFNINAANLHFDAQGYALVSAGGPRITPNRNWHETVISVERTGGTAPAAVGLQPGRITLHDATIRLFEPPELGLGPVPPIPNGQVYEPFGPVNIPVTGWIATGVNVGAGLPAGLTVSVAAGGTSLVLGGTPTGPAGGPFSFTVQPTGIGDSAPPTTITIPEITEANPIGVSHVPLPNMQVGEAIAPINIPVINGPASGFIAPDLPASLTLTPATIADNHYLVLAGVPLVTSATPTVFSIQAVHAGARPSAPAVDFTINVIEPLQIGVEHVVLSGGQVGVPFAQIFIPVTNGPATGFIAPGLPAGLTLAPATIGANHFLVLTGTPTTAAVSPTPIVFGIQATHATLPSAPPVEFTIPHIAPPPLPAGFHIILDDVGARGPRRHIRIAVTPEPGGTKSGVLVMQVGPLMNGIEEIDIGTITSTTVFDTGVLVNPLAAFSDVRVWHFDPVPDSFDGFPPMLTAANVVVSHPANH